jgi:hypothetical protein
MALKQNALWIIFSSYKRVHYSQVVRNAQSSYFSCNFDYIARILRCCGNFFRLLDSAGLALRYGQQQWI